MAAFTEEDVAASEPVSGKTLFRQVIDKGLAHNPRHRRGLAPQPVGLGLLVILGFPAA